MLLLLFQLLCLGIYIFCYEVCILVICGAGAAFELNRIDSDRIIQMLIYLLSLIKVTNVRIRICGEGGEGLLCNFSPRSEPFSHTIIELCA